MTDPRIIQLLARKLSGEATPEELAELDESLTHNPEAVYYAELLGQLWEEDLTKESTDTDMAYLKHLDRHEPEFEYPIAGEEDPPDFQGSSLQGSSLQGSSLQGSSLQSTSSQSPSLQGSSRQSSFLRRSARPLAWALGFLFVSAGIIYTGSRLRKRSTTGKTDSNTEFVAQLGSRKTIILPDGTHVRLNAGSSLHYDSNMLEKDLRSVALSGEAYFDVASDKDRPFVIHTDKIAIRVLGTAFNIRAYPHDRVTETTLLRGSVELTVNSRPYDKIILKPKEKFDLIDDTPEVRPPGAAGQDPVPHRVNKEKLVVQEVVPVEVADKEYVREVSWVDDNFVFQNETLEELGPKMERWFNVTMEIDNTAIRNFHFTGVFHKETIDQALSAMQLIKPFKFKINNNHVLIN